MLGKKKAGSAYKANNYKDHSYVARNTCVTGDINFVGGLHLEGQVNGNILGEEIEKSHSFRRLKSYEGRNYRNNPVNFQSIRLKNLQGY